MNENQDKFPIKSSPSASTIKDVLLEFNSKKEMEESWDRDNASETRAAIFAKLDHVLVTFPTVLLDLIKGYLMITWLEVAE